MIRVRRGRVVQRLSERPGVVGLSVDVDGTLRRALAYSDMIGPVEEGDRVLLNTTAVHYGLGTGGYDFVIAVEGRDRDRDRDRDPSPEGHIIKLRYTPMQVKVLAAEEPRSPHRAQIEHADRLDGLPVVWAPLHSMIGAVAAGARAEGVGRIVYVMTDGAALPSAFSSQIHDLCAAGLITNVVTVGQAFGGDLEAVNLFSGLLIARHVAQAEVVVVSDGPGKVGTSTRYGASEVQGGLALNVIRILGGSPIAVLRLNFSDPSYRHYGLSPHSLTVLEEVALVPVHVPVPPLEGAERDLVWHALERARLDRLHQVIEVDGASAMDVLASNGIEPQTMGRSPREEPIFFLAAGAAGVLAGKIAREGSAA